MADHGKVEYAAAKDNDYAEHEATYNLFIWLTKWGVITCLVIVALMFWFLT